MSANASRAASTVASISASPCALDRNHASNCDGGEVDAALEHRAVERREALRVGVELGVCPAPDRRLREEEPEHRSRVRRLAGDSGLGGRIAETRDEPPARARDPVPHAGLGQASRSVSIPAVIASGFPESVPAWYTGPAGATSSMISRRPPYAPTGRPPPMTLPSVVRSGVIPYSACAPPGCTRKPVMTSSKHEERALARRELAQPLEKALRGHDEPHVPRDRLDDHRGDLVRVRGEQLLDAVEVVELGA